MLPKGLLKEYSRAIAALIYMLDMATVLLAGWLAYVLRFGEATLDAPYWEAVAIGVLLTPMMLSFFNVYGSMRGKGWVGQIFNLIQAICAVSILMGGLAFFTKSGEAFLADFDS